MSNEIAAGKRVLFYAGPQDRFRTPGIVKERSGPLVWILAGGLAYPRTVDEVKLATQDTDPAAWMLHDEFTSRPVVHRDGCYICEDPEFAAMGLPLCRQCPQCLRRQERCGACSGTGDAGDKTPCTDCLGTGKLGGAGHIPADDNVCSDCGYEDGPGDYPLPSQSG